MPYRDPIPSVDPQLTEEEMLEQAGKILGLLKTRSVSEVARQMSMSRDTVYARMKLISRQIPDVDVVRVIHFERLEEMFEGLRDRTESDASNADYAKLVAEQRQVLARQSALLRVDGVEQSAPDLEPDAQMDDWVSAAKVESEAELARVRREEAS